MSMNRLKTLEDKVAYRITRAKFSVFVREDFQDLSDYDQIGRALRSLVKKKKLVRIGYGLYARARESSLSGKAIPEKPLPQLATEALERLGVDVYPSRLENAYNAGATTQVPTGRVIGVKGRISRKIGYDGKYITIERVTDLHAS